MSAVYPAAVDLFLTATIDVTTAVIKAQLTEGYTYSAAHDTLADVGAGTRVDAAVTLTTVAASGGAVTADPVTFTAVTIGHTIDGVVLYVDDGGGEAAPLLAHIDHRADTVPLEITTNDGDITLTWTRLFKI
jgi:hypothetical protein